jgi:hypothetical protein
MTSLSIFSLVFLFSPPPTPAHTHTRFLVKSSLFHLRFFLLIFFFFFPRHSFLIPDNHPAPLLSSSLSSCVSF